MDKTNTKKRFSVKVPHTLIIMFVLTLIMSILTWILPPGQYEYEAVEVEGVVRNLAVPGSFHYIDKSEGNPAGLLDFMSSFHKGLIEAADIVMLIFLVNAAFGLIIKTGAIHGFLGALLRKFSGKEKILIPLFFMIFALGGSLFGMLNEFNGLVPIFTGLGVALGYDPLVGMAIVTLGAYMGFAGSIMNPYTVVVSQSIAGVPIYSDSSYRVLIFLVICITAIWYIFRYAKKVKKDPTASFMYGIKSEHAFNKDELSKYELTSKHKIILLIVLASLGVIMWGSIKQGWGTIELTAIFLLMGIISAFVDGWSADKIAREIIEGSKTVVFAALITGIARASLIVLQEAKVVDTVINYLASALQGIPSVLGACGMVVVQTLIDFVIPSGSGQAAVTIPIMAPVGDVIGISRQVVTIAFQFGDALSNLLWPTGGAMVACGLSGVPIDKWWKFFLPLFGILYIESFILTAAAVLLGI